LLTGVSAKVRPSGLFSRAEDALKLSDDVIKADFIITPDSRIWDLSPMRLGAADEKVTTFLELVERITRR
jgi:hypothetical protein